MAKTTTFQRLVRCGMPYTSVARVPKVQRDENGEPIRNEQGLVLLDLVDGEVAFLYAVTGYTLEEHFVNNEEGEWHLHAQTHDLGVADALEDASRLAAEWRDELRGQYPLR